MTAPKILFVDDDEAMGAVFRRTFRHEPYDLLVVDCPRSAFACLKTSTVDVIVSDENMGEMSGRQLLALVAREHADVGRILLTGAIDMDMERVERCGHMLLLKPVATPDFRAAVAAVVARTRARRSRG